MNSFSINQLEPGDILDTYSGSTLTVLDINGSMDILVQHNDVYQHESVTTASALRTGRVKNPYHPTVFGIGYIGIGKYKCSENGRLTQVYNIWSRMLQRCYAPETNPGFSTYVGCHTCVEWHDFQNFAKWYYNNPYYGLGYDLDKDLIIKGNRMYSPYTCTLIPRELNKAISTTYCSNSGLPIGVYQSGDRYIAFVRGYIEGDYLGTYSTAEEAKYYRDIAKKNHILNLASKWGHCIDYRAYNALVNWIVD